ncbi:hypothetical protein BC937DRAFT_91715 [Endogone sp. FLAS-F59071]|nr:hypothetical protein BC937DRAFT_91715 [Endogone sp. FLAS-F59071]|eukprot:RUS21720.1 hypothetical protein BC937DRAFT_91715 [Endogone sp. FLAS-F59071]
MCGRMWVSSYREYINGSTVFQNLTIGSDSAAFVLQKMVSASRAFGLMLRNVDGSRFHQPYSHSNNLCYTLPPAPHVRTRTRLLTLNLFCAILSMLP